MPWNEVENFCKPGFVTTDGLVHVPVIYRGKYDKDKILEAFNAYCEKVAPQEVEGFVVRNSDAFFCSEFKDNVAKFVRKNHVQTDEHWTKHWTNNEIE